MTNDPEPTAWIKNAKCGPTGDCIEVAFVDEGVMVRDSEDPTVIMRVTRSTWMAFLQAVARGEFHPPA